MPEIEFVQCDVPKYLETLQLPDPNLLNYYKNLENRCFYVDTEIGDDITEIAKSIIQFNRDDKDLPVEQRRPTKIIINSPGGVLDSTMALVEVCGLSKTPIYTYNLRMAFSAGLLILLAGHKRFCLQRSRVLIHSGSSSGGAGTYEQVESATADYRKVVAQMRDFIISRTNITSQLLNKKKANDWYLYTDEQIQYGIVDKVVENIEELL